MLRSLTLALLLVAPAWANAVEVSKAVICKEVEKRAPVGVSARFPANVGHLFAHITLANRGEPTTVDAVWRHADERIARVSLNVGRAARWRTWAKLRVSPKRTGPWSLEVIDAEGRRLAYVPFVVGEGGEAPPAPVIHRAEQAPRADPKPVEPATPAPVVAAPRPVAPTPLARSTCRALVNVRLDGGGHTTYHSAAIDLRRDRPRAQVVNGLVVVDNGRQYALHVGRHVAQEESPGGRVLRRWDQLVGLPLPSGRPKVWYAYPATLAPPSRPGPKGKPQRFVEENLLEIESVMGPYVGLRASLAGQAGGPRGFDHSRYATVRAPGVLVDVPQLVGGELPELAQMRAAELRGRGLANPPNAAKHDLRRSAFVGTPAGLRLNTLMRCCSWAENRGLLDVDVELERAPTSLAPFAPEADGWYVGPNECAAVRQGESGVEVKVGGSEPKPLRIAGAHARLLGVRWVDATFELTDQETLDDALERLRPAGRPPAPK